MSPLVILLANIRLLAETNPIFTLGAGGSVTALLGYLLSELRKSSSGTWRIVRDKNATIHRLQYDQAERDHRNAWNLATEQYRRGIVENELFICKGVAQQGSQTYVQDPGPYVPYPPYEPPTAEELDTWQ